MKRLNSFFLASLGILLLAGCSTTKVNLYEYKDVSSVAIVDEDKANYKVVRPKLNANIRVDTNGWKDLQSTMSDYFLAYNDRRKVFELDKNGSYRLKLTLHNVDSNQQYTPPRFVEKKRKIKTDKGVIIKDESYYTKPYWTYTVETAAVAELIAPGGEKKFFESSDTSSYSINGKYPSEVPRSKYIESLQETLSKILNQIANDVAPEGLVVSKKVALDDDEDYIFMVNMGKEEGLYEGQTLQMYKEVIFKDEIDAKMINNKVRIGTAKVSDQIMPHYAWIVMDDSDQNRLIEVGDIIRPMY